MANVNQGKVVSAEELKLVSQALADGGGPRADLRPDIFEAIIRQKGYRMIWEQAMFCSCYDNHTGQPDFTCPACKGKGYLYFGAQEIWAVVGRISGYKDQHRLGLDEVGSAYLTPQARHNVGYRDRFTLVDFTSKFSEILEVGKDDFRYPCQDILRVANRGIEYKEGTHFTISQDKKRIVWKDSTFIEPGTRYSVLYSINPVYIAIGPIHEIRGTYSKLNGKGADVFHQLPKQYQMKREDFLDE